jgi:AraC family transcriptional regulator, arabinose operon regulatory protein
VSIFHNLWNFTNLLVPYWRLIWHLEGRAEISHESRQIPLFPQKQILITPQAPLSCHSSQPVRQLFFYFTIDGRAEKTKPGIFEIENHTGIEYLFHDILIASRVNEQLPIDVYQQVAALCQLSLSRLPESYYSGRRIIDDRISKAVSMLSADLHKRIKMQDVADFCGLSIKSLERKFQAIFLESPLQYRQELKIEQACAMLHFSDFSIEEIAERLGYSDRFHFTKTFTKLKSISPGKFRKGWYE